MLDIVRLQVLLHVIEQGSVTGAAAQLSYTPSAVSQQLRRLEREVGQPLLDRHARGMVPTEAGEVLAGHARKVVRQLRAAESDLAEIAGVRRGQLSIGTFATVGSSFVPLAVQRFRQLYPSIRMNIHSERELGLIEMVEEGRVGLSLLWDYPWRRLDQEQLAVTTLFEDPMVVVVASEHPLADQGAVSMGQLAGDPWIIRSDGHPVVEVLHRSALAAGFEPRISFEANDYQEAQAMVSVGFGIALAPRTAMTNPRPGVRVLSLDESAPTRRIVVVHRHDRVRTPAEIAFHEVLLEMAREYDPQ